MRRREGQEKGQGERVSDCVACFKTNSKNISSKFATEAKCERNVTHQLRETTERKRERERGRQAEKAKDEHKEEADYEERERGRDSKGCRSRGRSCLCQATCALAYLSCCLAEQRIEQLSVYPRLIFIYSPLLCTTPCSRQAMNGC